MVPTEKKRLRIKGRVRSGFPRHPSREISTSMPPSADSRSTRDGKSLCHRLKRPFRSRAPQPPSGLASGQRSSNSPLPSAFPRWTIVRRPRSTPETGYHPGIARNHRARFRGQCHQEPVDPICRPADTSSNSGFLLQHRNSRLLLSRCTTTTRWRRCAQRLYLAEPPTVAYTRRAGVSKSAIGGIYHLHLAKRRAKRSEYA